MSRAKTPLDEVAQSIALAGSFKNPNSPDKRALQFPYPIPKQLPAITASKQRQRPDILPFSTSISSEREARERASLEEDERRLKEEEHEAFLAHMRAKDDAERAMLKVRGEMIDALENFDFSNSFTWKLPTQILSYFRTLSSDRKEQFERSVRSLFMANLDHVILRYEQSQTTSKQAGVYAPDVIATRLSSELLLDSKKKGAKLNIPYLCEAVLRSQMVELNLLEREEESTLSSEPISRVEQRKLQQQQQQQQEQRLLNERSNTSSGQYLTNGVRVMDSLVSSSSIESGVVGDEFNEKMGEKDGSTRILTDSLLTSQKSQSIRNTSSSSSLLEMRRSAPRSVFWMQKRGGGLITDAVGNVKHGETMSMLTNVWLAERGVTTTASDVRNTLAQSLDLNELRMTDTSAAEYVDTLLVGDDDAGRNSKAFLKGAYALDASAASSRWMRAPVSRGEDHGDGNEFEIRAQSISDSLGVHGSNGPIPTQDTLRTALGSKMRDSPASIATLSSKAAIVSLQSMLKRRNDKAASSIAEIENTMRMKTTQPPSYSSSHPNRAGRKPPSIHDQAPSSAKEARALIASVENVKASQEVFDFKASALVDPQPPRNHNNLQDEDSSFSSSSSSSSPSSSINLPVGGLRLSVTEIAPSLTSRVILQRKNVVVVSQDNTPSTSDALAGRRSQDEINLLYKGGRVEAIHRLPIYAKPEPALIETRDDQVPVLHPPPLSSSFLEGSDFSSYTSHRSNSLLLDPSRLVSDESTTTHHSSYASINAPAPIFQHPLVSESLRRVLEPRTAVDTEDIHAKSRRRSAGNGGGGGRRRSKGIGGEEGGGGVRPSTPEGVKESRARDKEGEKETTNGTRRMSSSSSSSSSSFTTSSLSRRSKWFHQHGYTPGASVSQAPTHNTSIAALLGPFSAKKLLVEQGVKDSGELVMLKIGALQTIRNRHDASMTEGSQASSFAPNSSIFSELTSATAVGDRVDTTSGGEDILVQTLFDSQSLPLAAGTRNRVLGKAGAANPLMSFKIKEKTDQHPMKKKISLKKELYLI